MKLMWDVAQSVHLKRVVFDLLMLGQLIVVIAGVLVSHQCTRIKCNDGIYVHAEARVRGSGGSVVCRWNLPISSSRQRE